MSKDPDYTDSNWSYKKRIATKCRICGKQLLDPADCKKETHKECRENYKDNNYSVS
jgi:hypothetical protein